MACWSTGTGAPAPRSVQTPKLVPAPASLTAADGAPFTITALTSIITDGGEEGVRIGEVLALLLRPSTGFPLPVSSSTSSAPLATPGITLRLAADRDALGDEGYELTVDADAIRLVARRPAGLFRGVQTLRQLLPPEVESHMKTARTSWMIAPVAIVDQPRFRWRGAMLDVARHFFTVQEVEQYIDLLALYKLNVLHLHLADDQGWRIAITSHPELTALGSSTQVGSGDGGFYTQSQYAEIVRYAGERYVMIVPEIDMPGHINAALIGHPELSCGTRPPAPYRGTDVGWSTVCVDKEETYALVDDVVREIAALSPGPYFHVGGDEVQTLSVPQYTRFIERVQGIVGRHGKQMIGWEEIAKARLQPTTVAQQWKSDSVRAAVQYGARILLSPASRVYLDMQYTPATELGLHWAGYVELHDTYDWNPGTYLAGVDERSIIGVEAPMWSETLRNIGAVEYLAVPRLPALAEVGWTAQEGRSWNDFRARIATHAPRWHYLGVNYHRSPQVAW
jgi:hexosaminidase